MDLHPNNTGFTSMPTNDPFSWSGDTNDISTVGERVALVAPDGSAVITPQGPVNSLSKLRQQFPFLPIIPFPTVSRAVVCTNASQSYDIRVPTGSAVMLCRGNADFYLSLNGNAQVPSATNANGDRSDASDTNSSFFAPQGYLFYVAGVNSFSVVSPLAGTVVTFLFYAPSEMPR